MVYTFFFDNRIAPNIATTIRIDREFKTAPVAA